MTQSRQPYKTLNDNMRKINRVCAEYCIDNILVIKGFNYFHISFYNRPTKVNKKSKAKKYCLVTLFSSICFHRFFYHYIISVALEKQRQEYEKQFQQLRNILSPTTPYAPYMPFDPLRGTKMTPSTPTSQLRIEKWAQERYV